MTRFEENRIETVKDLIEKLQKLPSDACISFCDYDGDFEAEIRWDITQEEYKDGYEDQPYIYLTRPSTWRR
jgi:hypothetical protein